MLKNFFGRNRSKSESEPRSPRHRSKSELEPPSPRNRSTSQEVWPDRQVYPIELSEEDVKQLQVFLFFSCSENDTVPNIYTEGMSVASRLLFYQKAREHVGKSSYPHFDSVQLPNYSTANNKTRQFLSKACIYAVQQNRLEYLLCCLAIYEINSRLKEDSADVHKMINFISTHFMQGLGKYQLNLGSDLLTFDYLGRKLNSQQIRTLWDSPPHQPHDLIQFAAIVKVTKQLLQSHFLEYFPKFHTDKAQTASVLTLKGAVLMENRALFNDFKQHGFEFIDKYKLDVDAICAQTEEVSSTSSYQSKY